MAGKQSHRTRKARSGDGRPRPPAQSERRHSCRPASSCLCPPADGRLTRLQPLGPEGCGPVPQPETPPLHPSQPPGGRGEPGAGQRPVSDGDRHARAAPVPGRVSASGDRTPAGFPAWASHSQLRRCHHWRGRDQRPRNLSALFSQFPVYLQFFKTQKNSV